VVKDPTKVQKRPGNHDGIDNRSRKQLYKPSRGGGATIEGGGNDLLVFEGKK